MLSNISENSMTQEQLIWSLITCLFIFVVCIVILANPTYKNLKDELKEAKKEHKRYDNIINDLSIMINLLCDIGMLKTKDSLVKKRSEMLKIRLECSGRILDIESKIKNKNG